MLCVWVCLTKSGIAIWTLPIVQALSNQRRNVKRPWYTMTWPMCFINDFYDPAKLSHWTHILTIFFCHFFMASEWKTKTTDEKKNVFLHINLIWHVNQIKNTFYVPVCSHKNTICGSKTFEQLAQTPTANGKNRSPMLI